LRKRGTAGCASGCSSKATRQTQKPSSTPAAADYDELLEQGVEIAEYQPRMLHTKAMVIDGLLSVVGSANFDNRSLELNDELNAAVFDRGLASRLLQDFERDLTEAKKLDLESWRRRSPIERGRDWLWSYFGEVF
jgi:cardiolipin synthase